MQLYQVDFQTHFENMIDIGSVLVCAADKDEARSVALYHLQLPTSKTVTNVVRLKPNLYPLQRRQVAKFNDKPERPDRPRKEQQPLQRFAVSVSASINARSEEHALRQVTGVMSAKCTAPNSKPAVPVMIDCHLVEPKRAMKPLEQVETYKARIR